MSVFVLGSPPPPLVVPPDVEEIVVAYLLSRAEITAITSLVATTTLDVNDPCLRVTLVPGGRLRRSRPLWNRTNRVAIDSYGGSKATASELARTAQAVLADVAFIGVQPGGGVVANVAVGDEHYNPDDSNPAKPARPAYQFDVLVETHP